MKSFALPIFGCRIYYTDDKTEAQAWLDKQDYDEKLTHCDGMCAGHAGRFMVYAKSPETLAHECYHAARAVLREIGDESADEEVAAHLLEYIYKQCSS